MLYFLYNKGPGPAPVACSLTEGFCSQNEKASSSLEITRFRRIFILENAFIALKLYVLHRRLVEALGAFPFYNGSLFGSIKYD